ncbi:MAG TPA: carboxypeptidase-like regulatory domain-containing protein [Polyangiaceae bacterium]|nr:carboxypeptidase-like regulatory domain-containing protein [Polyangiaceae bacterium]
MGREAKTATGEAVLTSAAVLNGAAMSIGAAMFTLATLFSSTASAEPAAAVPTPHAGATPTPGEPSARVSVTVLGGLQVEATNDVGGAGTRLRGRVTDELGAPRPSAVVRLLNRATKGCDGGGDDGRVTTNEQGEFCIELDERKGETSTSDYRVEVRAEGYETYSGGLTAPADSRPAPRFVTAPLAVELDGDAPVVLEVWSSGPGPGRLLVQARSARGTRTLGDTRVTSDELTRFEVSPAEFGSPGRAELLAQRTNEMDGAPGPTTRFPIDLRARVRLTVLEFTRSGGDFEVAVGARSRDESVGAGLIEVRDAATGAFLASATLEDGNARVSWFDDTPSARLRLDYAPAGSHHLPGPSTLLDVPPSSGPSPRTWLTALALLALLAWLARRWTARRQPPARQLPDSLEVELPTVRRGGAAGDLRDAHTDEPLPDVPLELLERTATGEHLLATTTTDAHGRFSFAPTTSQGGPRVVRATPPRHRRVEVGVESRSHERPLRLRTTELRRASLALLVERARDASRRSPPTPAEAGAAWRRSGQDERAHWADAVEGWAYGPRPPSEADIDHLRVAWRNAAPPPEKPPTPQSPSAQAPTAPTPTAQSPAENHSGTDNGSENAAADTAQRSETRGSADIDGKGPQFL